MHKFWLIWCPEGNRPPKFQHGTRESADREALRLAEKYPTEEFYVMEAMGMACHFSAPCSCCHGQSKTHYYEPEEGPF